MAGAPEPDMSMFSDAPSAAPAAAVSAAPAPDLSMFDAPKPPPKPSFISAVGHELGEEGRMYGHEVAEAGRQFGHDARVAVAPKTADELKQQQFDSRMPGGPGVRLAMDAANYVSSPFNGVVDAIVGRPGSTILNKLGVHTTPEQVGGYAQMAVPLGGEVALAREAKALAKAKGMTETAAREMITAERANAARTGAQAKAEAADPTHAAHVALLKREGVHLTPGMEAGGAARAREEARTSNPYYGAAHVDAQHGVVDSVNRAVYNRVLGPLGEHYGPTDPVGRKGVAAVEAHLHDAYEKALPHVRLNADHQLDTDLAEIRTSVAKLGKPQEGQFEAILNQDVLHHFQEGGMDGHAFKKVESDLLRQSRDLKSSPDPNARGLGHALEDALDALRSDMERSSPPAWRERLRNINQSYAMFTRLQDATTHRAISGGRFTPGDLLSAVRKGDRTVRKGAFARGDALLQDFAEAAQAVTPNKMPNSFTADRLMAAGRGPVSSIIGAGVGEAVHPGFGSLVGAAVGPPVDQAIGRATNAAAKRVLENKVRTSAVRKPPTRIAPAVGAAGASQVLQQIMNGQGQ
jgi:hypothetical protein